MNYRTMVKGALALSLSLIVGSSWAGDSQQYGATFEQTPVGTVENDFAYTEGDGITNAKYRVTQDVDKPYGWFSGSEEDESKIIAANGGHALQLNTDASTLTNKLAEAIADEINTNGIAKAGAFFETDVKFVASDTPDAGIEGGTDATKFAIYAYCNEEAETVTTNLVVYHGVMGDLGITYTNEVFEDVTIDTEAYTKLRIEMKKLTDPNDPLQTQYNVFSVKVGSGEPISSDTAFDALIEEKPTGTWFLTTEDVNSAPAKQVASLNFKGTGEIDNIKAGVIEEAQPPDDNWTIEGFNPRGEWTDPTAVAADSKTLFYSNLVVNIDAADSDIGRTIDAAWIGAKIIAPEAVTSENASQWTIAVGSATYTFDQVKESEGNYFYLWVPVTAAKVRTAIATQSDIVYTVEAYTDPSAKQILSMVINPKNIEITNTSDVPNAETIEVIDWAEQGVVEPTVISVAKLSATGAMVNDAAPTLTATVTDENGDPVAAADYTIDASAIDMTTAGLYPVVITATGAGYAGTLTNYYAVMNLTWFNGTPTQKALIKPPFDMNKIHYMHRSQDDVYLAVHGGNGSDGGSDSLFSIATLKGLYGYCTSNWEVAGNHGSINYGSKGAAVNTVKNIMLLGRGVNYRDNPVRVYDISSFNGQEFISTNTYTTVWTGSGYDVKGSFEPDVRMDGIDFSHDGSYIFGNNAGEVSADNGGPYGGDGPWVYQLAVDTNAKTLSWVATYTSDFARVRSVSSYYIDNKDYVFIGEGASSGKGEIAVIDPSDGSITKICTAADDFTTAEFPAGRYFTNVKVSGIGTGEMYLYGSTDSGEVVIWALGHDAVTGEWKTAPVGNITAAQTAALNSKTSVGNTRAFEVSGDNTTGFLYVLGTPGQMAVVTDISLAQRKALASATLTPAGSDKDVALGAITATVLDENGATVAASEYTIATNGIDIATAGEYTVTITPVEGSVYSNAVTAVYTISEPASRVKPEWATDANDVKFWAWVDGNNVSDYDTVDYSAQYLMNVAPGVTPVLKIDSIQVGPGAAVIIVSATDGTNPISLATINGVLNVAVGSSVTALTPKALGRDPVVSQDGRAMVVISTVDGSFYRARVDFAAAETALTPVVISGGE